jgi:hypothetical protein
MNKTTTPSSSNKVKERDPKTVNLQTTNNLHEFLHGYVCIKEHFDWNPTQPRTNNWDFFLQILRLIRTSYSFGWFKNDQEYLLPRLREILDTGTDFVLGKS